jgi:hypothetical protein
MIRMGLETRLKGITFDPRNPNPFVHQVRTLVGLCPTSLEGVEFSHRALKKVPRSILRTVVESANRTDPQEDWRYANVNVLLAHLKNACCQRFFRPTSCASLSSGVTSHRLLLCSYLIAHLHCRAPNQAYCRIPNREIRYRGLTHLEKAGMIEKLLEQ